LSSLARLAPIDVSEWQASDGAFAEAEFTLGADRLPEEPDSTEIDAEVARMVPRRLVRGPISAASYVTRLDEAERDEWWELNQRLGKEASRTVPVLAQYWTDGQRTMTEIGQRVRLETGLEATLLLAEYFRFLEQLRLVVLEEEEHEPAQDRP
jgi:hypothetical protein